MVTSLNDTFYKCTIPNSGSPGTRQRNINRFKYRTSHQMCVKLLIERHIDCVQISKEIKGKIIRSLDCNVSVLEVMLSLFVEFWFEIFDVALL